MKIKHTKKQDLTYEIIRNAVNGDEDAEEIIFDYYEPYIIKLSKLPYINNEGEVAYVIDEDIYMSLKLKLRKIKTAMLDEAEESLEILRKKHETSQNVAEGNDSWLEIFKEYQNISELKREAVALFINNIVFHKDKRVEVTFVYETELDELNKISDNLKAEQEVCSEAV